MVQQELHRILVKGGVLSPSELKRIMKMCSDMGLSTVSFGSRQDILFAPTENEDAVFADYPEISVEKIGHKNYQNIVCSYLTVDIFDKTAWTSSSTFLYLLSNISEENKHSINIVDPVQQFVPIFTGNLNFVCSRHESYWYLYMKLPGWESNEKYPVLIHTLDVPLVTKALQELDIASDGMDEIFEKVCEVVDPSKNRNISVLPQISKDLFPYYEGMHRMADGSYWLGLYWRKNNYYIDFLSELAELCLECKIGNLCITPWKSIIVKKIGKKDKLKWEKLLGMHGINVRHSLLELNWHLPLNDPEALDLKTYIVRIFDQKDISTYGLTLGIYDHDTTNFFTTIAIVRNQLPQIDDAISLRPTYSVLHSKKFMPHETEYVFFAQDIDKLELPGILIEVSKIFYDKLGNVDESRNEFELNPASNGEVETVLQCQDCLTIIEDAQMTTCEVCGALAGSFKKVILPFAK